MVPAGRMDIPTLRQCGIGIKNREGKFIINPPDETIVAEGVKVIVISAKSQT